MIFRWQTNLSATAIRHEQTRTMVRWRRQTVAMAPLAVPAADIVVLGKRCRADDDERPHKCPYVEVSVFLFYWFPPS